MIDKKMFNKKFDFLNNNFFLEMQKEFSKVEAEKSNLHKDLEDLFGRFNFKRISEQIDKFLKNNTDYEFSEKKTYRILCAYEKLAMQELDFYQCFFVVTILLDNLPFIYARHAILDDIDLDKSIDNLIFNEADKIHEFKNRQSKIYYDKRGNYEQI